MSAGQNDNTLNDRQLGREKYWKEISIEEKIERMRAVVNELMRDHARLNDLVIQTTSEFEKHEHHDGKIMFSMRALNEYRISDSYFPGKKARADKSKNPDETYF